MATGVNAAQTLDEALKLMGWGLPDSIVGTRPGWLGIPVPSTGLEAFGRSKPFPTTVIDRTAYLALYFPPAEALLGKPTEEVTKARKLWEGEKDPRRRQHARQRLQKAEAALKTATQTYPERLADHACKAAHVAFATLLDLERVAVSIYQFKTDPMRGNDYFACVLAVMVDRKTWESIIHSKVTSENALKNFSHRLRYDRRLQLQDVAPFSPPTTKSQTTGSLSLQELDPVRFEELVWCLLDKMGYQATLTKASHDGGVDIVAVNPDPIVGGKVIVQCKRHLGTIGAPVVRDLYGSLTHERAMKGILITTSDFSSDAIRFAEGKPIELLNGRRFSELLRRYNVSI